MALVQIGCIESKQEITRSVIADLDSTFLNYPSNDFVFISSSLCDYFLKYNDYPKNRVELENYLKEEKSFPDYKLEEFSNLEYGLLNDTSKKSSIFYSFGLDGNDDRGSKLYNFNDSILSNAKGDLLLREIKYSYCEKMKRRAMREAYFFSFGQQIIENNIKFRSKIGKIVKSTIDQYYDKGNKLYIAKAGEEIKITIISGKKNVKNGWILNIEQLEHETDEIELVLKSILKEINKSPFLKKHEIDRFRIPIVYFDRTQIQEL